MAQGHKPDEFISTDQMDQCEIMLEKLVTRLCQSSPGTP
jgi:acetylornithine deacetylase/succinyl-diaminopimelate desuccinylase-like protein